MSTAIPIVYRGSQNRPVGWNLYSDLEALVPYILPPDAVVVMTITANRRKLTLSTDDDEMSLILGDEDTPAQVSWSPTKEQSRMFGVGRAHVELEYWPPSGADEIPLLLADAAIDFVNGRNTDR